MISLRQLDDEVRQMAAHGGIDPSEVVVVLWTPAEEQARTDRDFAYVYGPIPEIHFSKHTLELGPAHREALIGHELGHVLSIRRRGDYSEPGADDAARELLGVPICYDRRYSGKGLQVRCANPRELIELDEIDTDAQGRPIYFMAQPFPYERKPFVPSRIERGAYRSRVPIRSLVGTQHRVTAHGVQKYLAEDRGEQVPFEDLPMVYRTPSGKAYIADGHHRASAAWLRGEDDLEVRAVEIDENPIRTCMPRTIGVARRLANGYTR